MVMQIVNANFGRLEADDGSAETCPPPAGVTNENKIDCSADGR